MPYDSSGNASVTRNIAVTGQTVLAEQVNVPFADIQSMLSQVLLRSGVAPMTGQLNMNGFKVSGASDGVAATDLATVGQVQSALPIGSLVDYAGANAPDGWVLCYGQAISRTAYPSLFSVIGTIYGVGDNATTFNVPDCRGRIIAGKDDMGGTSSNRLSSFWSTLATTIGGAFGTASHVLTEAQIPSHVHSGTTVLGGAHSHQISVGGAGAGGVITANGNSITSTGSTLTGGDHAHSFTTNATGGGSSHTNTQPTLIMNKMIKAY